MRPDLLRLAFAVALAGCTSAASPATNDLAPGHQRLDGSIRGNDSSIGGSDGAVAGSDGAIAGIADLAGPTDGGASDGALPSVQTEFAPYFYTWGWGSKSYAFGTLAAMKQQGGPAAATLAFVLSNSGACAVTTDIHDNLTDVKAFVNAGGHLKASFGGADGTYLENACADSTSLATAIGGFVDDTGISDLDFDIEQGSTSSNSTINAMRAAALKSVQDSKHIKVAFTLPVNPDGLDSLGLAVVKAALAAGVTISYVNVMTMDYGGGTNLGTTPTSSADATAKQLQGLIANLSLDAAYRMVGVTPMIGNNDDSEVFSIADAQTLISYAKAKKLGLVSYWAIQRDEKCPSGVDLDVCNGVSASTFQFSQIFAGVNH